MEQVNITIFTKITALTFYYIEDLILDFVQGLWFVKCMMNLRINPDLFRKFGIHICDYQTDPRRQLVIKASKNYFS